MTENYITLSLETHLFFARIMKEHAFFLEAGFPCKEKDWIEKADHFRKEFEELLALVVKLSNNRVNAPVLNSGELVTEFTIPAERQTGRLSGVPFDTELTGQTAALRPGSGRENNRELFKTIHKINNRAVFLLNGLISFKESILREVSEGKLFTFNYPLLIEHIIREARLYRSTIDSLMRNRPTPYFVLWGSEDFWNQIMMEHALFIRGLLDPSEEELVKTANDFAMDYKKLLEMAKTRDGMATRTMADRSLTEASLKETLKYRDFKAAGTKGILNLEIDSIIIPLLADHVLREANHYLRILELSTAAGTPRMGGYSHGSR